ncbi:MAG: YIP1 family protein [Thermoanaerobaculia bacterium]|nr:YIP1 family protein [Thermoanaerobaculia bacterium]
MNEPTTTPPPPHDPPPPSGPTGNAWERRGTLGFVQGLIEAAKGFVVAPGATFAETRRSGDLASPLLFAVLLNTVAALIGQIWAMLIGTSFLSMLPAEMREGLGMMMVSSGAGLIVSVVVVPIVTVIGVFIGSAILHLMLLLVGGTESSTAGFEGSLRVVCYSGVGQLGRIVPVLGGLIATVWTVVLLVIGLTRLHGTSEGKAIAAVLLPLVICCLCVMGAFMMGVGGAVLSGLQAQ